MPGFSVYFFAINHFPFTWLNSSEFAVRCRLVVPFKLVRKFEANFKLSSSKLKPAAVAASLAAAVVVVAVVAHAEIGNVAAAARRQHVASAQAW